MPNYNLQDFETWLNENPARKKGKDEDGWRATMQSFFGSDENQQEELLELYAEDEILAPYAEAIKEWKSELDQRERERESNNNPPMFYLSENFKKWLAEDLTHQKDLPHWEELFQHFGDQPITTNFTATELKLIANWEKDYGNLVAYCEVFWDWTDQDAARLSYAMPSSEWRYRAQLKLLINTFAETYQELRQIKEVKETLTTQLNEQASNLNNLRQKLDQLKSELTSKQQEQKELENKLTGEQIKSTDLEQQLTALAVSSGLLTQQIENLTQQLSASEQKEKSVKLEAEIKDNLLKQKEQLLKDKDNQISQQTAQIQSCQNLCRQNDEQLKKCQDLITQKTEQLTALAEEKENIQTELDQAQEKIKQLENSLLTSQTKIQQLEAQIKTLKNKPGNSNELEQLKKELASEKQKHQTEKTKSQSEINRLKNELNQAKCKEEQLSQKIQALSKKTVQVPETQEQKSLWQTIKTPLFYTGGIILIVIVVGWICSKFREK